jgi:hypothetical protein
VTGRVWRQPHARLLAHAHELRREAKRCADSDAYFAACVMLGAALEANLLATVLVCEARLRAAGVWPKGKGNPMRWGLGQLMELATDADWLGVFDVDGWEGENAGDALHYLRNGVHPGRFVRQIEPGVFSGPFGYFNEQTYRELVELLKMTFRATAWARQSYGSD